MSTHPIIGAVHTGCSCCAPKPEIAPMDWQPHPGFGEIYLRRDGYPRGGSLSEDITFREIEAIAADDPGAADHDWRLFIYGPLVGAVYQRQGCAQWVAVERLDGFA